jgi:phage-related tail protein
LKPEPGLKKGRAMEKDDVLEIAEGMRLIEEGVAKIQEVMRTQKIKSLKEVAEKLIPLFNKEDDSLTESVVKHLG